MKSKTRAAWRAAVAEPDTLPPLRGNAGKGGFAVDLSSEAQSRRGQANKGKTPWRCGPICNTKAAHARFAAHNLKIDRRKVKP